MTNIIHTLVSQAIKSGVIQEEKASIYEYGLEDFFCNFFTWCVFLVIGGIINMFWYTLLFMTVHVPLRMYAGGIHCATRIRCFMVSTCITALVFALPVFLPFSLLASALQWLAIPNLVVIWIFAPVEDLRKPLNVGEQRFYKKVSFLVCTAATVAFFAFRLMLLDSVVYFIGAAITVVSTQLVLGKVKNSVKKKVTAWQ